MKRMAFVVLLAAVMVSTATPSTAQTGKAQTGFINLRYVVDGATKTGALWIPPQYDGREKLPMIVYLHGSGRRGDNSDNALNEWLDSLAIVQAIRKNPERFPVFVLIPRAPTQIDEWTPVLPGTWGREIKNPPATDGRSYVDSALKVVLDTYQIDRERMVLTGKSIGGHGTYGYAALHPELFAAIAPIAGYGSPQEARALGRLKAWVFHGLADTSVVPEISKNMVAALKEAGADVRHTEYPGVTHDDQVEIRTYSDPEVIKWLVSQRRSGH